ncbi:sensory transduction histidine kinase domain protein [Escherichia coli 2-474-04_S1_C2]|nr:sensory transduction histidine kinase domain protein [Escherichia coli 8.0566]EKK70415.1 sensory transduction histidine kinase domain protein [Escherichia coli 8.0416]KDV93598.1 sensory transduction histidine kinase domain protein [Escherichia coli 2-156-04_S1_C3]KDX37711.1 sensory transduction histidine kinase domain protein [Escherichia coli 2-156-04_S4_C2]KDY99618.1 sensory transduction histidine kinase domain protein [Escherichia coli 2-474-04_S1_C2]
MSGTQRSKMSDGTGVAVDAKWRGQGADMEHWRFGDARGGFYT